MRLLWVQQWTVLPVIVEDGAMSDENSQQTGRLLPGGQAMDPSARQRLSEREGPLTPPENVGAGNVPYEFSPQGPTHLQHLPGGQPLHAPGQQSGGYQLGRGQSPGAFSMSGMAGALPDYQSSASSQMSHHDQQRFLAGTQSGGGASPYSQNTINTANFPVHPSQYGSAYHYGQVQQSPQSASGGPSPIHASYSGGTYFAPQQQQHAYYPGQYGQISQTQAGPYPSYGSAGNQGYEQQPGEMGRQMHSGYAPGPFSSRVNSSSSTGSIPSTPRGPPRKPKQSGHALWVGNLPSGTVVGDLKDHFSRDATKDIESVFLISKSNCAFVNYRTETACAAAMSRFHDSRFQGVRLVCRLRRNSGATSAPGIPTGPAALAPAVAYTQTAFEAITQNREVSSKAFEEAAAGLSRAGEPTVKVHDKYFIMKSLTVEDMELSTAENVYLIFSANKSGEYFGFARMASPITEEAAAGLDWAPRGEIIIDDPEIPRSFPTAPTEFAPKGRIIDDSARGTIFWEADPEDEERAPIIDHELDDPKEVIEGEEKGEEGDEAVFSGDAQAFGKPFKIEWLATNRLPFYRTRGLRNPWNANREVKIARDGTELETSVGRRLVQMFQKAPSLPEGAQPPLGWSPGRSY
ncbi:hypothetical protein P7C71_g129, partial [Lecanoromycetidae sp. Uapishka_2]